MPSGRVYVASMILRGSHAAKPSGCLRVNATSGQRKNHPHRIAFSPMTFKKFKGYPNFESWWQVGKHIQGVDRVKQVRYWLRVGHDGKPKRRYPNSKNKKVLYAKWDGGEKMNYIDSRKKMYVPEYFNMIKDEKELKKLINYRNRGGNIVVYDYDGPFEGKTPVALEVNESMLREKINDPKRPFGHGYVVAAAIAGILPDVYTL